MSEGRAWLSNRRLFQIHGWLGINVGLLLFIVCFSGAIATLSHEIEWLLNPALRATPPADGARYTPWTAWYAAAQEAHPGARILSIDHPDGPRWTVRVTVAYSGSDWRFVFVDPFTAQVTGSFSEFGVVRFFRSFHKQLYIYPGSLPHGVYAVGPLGLILLLSLGTGLSFYKFRWRDLLMRGPWRNARAFWSSLHRATGMWIVPMAFLITATGVWYFAERALEDADIPIPEASVVRYAPPVPPPDPDPDLWPMPIEEAVALAERTVPHFRVGSVSFSSGPTPMLTLHGQTDAWLVRNAANVVRINPKTARVEQVAVAGALHPVTRLSHTADPLHFGTFGGLTTKLIWCIAGLLSSLAILLGVRVWYLRIARASGSSTRPAGVVTSLGLTLTVLGVSIYGCLVNIGDALANQPAARFEPVGSRELGPISLRLKTAVAGGQMRIAGSVSPGDDRAALRRGWAWLGRAEAPATIPDEAVALNAGWAGLAATLDISRGDAGADHLWLAVEDRTGARFIAGAGVGHLLSGTGVSTPPEIVPLYVWIVVGLFTTVVALVCVGWFWWIQRNAWPSHGVVAARRPAGRLASQHLSSSR